MAEHRLTVDSIKENGNAEFRITHCPEDDTCAVWRECDIEGCAPPEGEEEAVEGVTLHGVEHRYLDYGWFRRDTPHNCGLQYADEWGGLDEVGEYVCDVDYLGDGNWWPVGITRAVLTDGGES